MYSFSALASFAFEAVHGVPAPASTSKPVHALSRASFTLPDLGACGRVSVSSLRTGSTNDKAKLRHDAVQAATAAGKLARRRLTTAQVAAVVQRLGAHCGVHYTLPRPRRKHAATATTATTERATDTLAAPAAAAAAPFAANGHQLPIAALPSDVPVTLCTTIVEATKAVKHILASAKRPCRFAEEAAALHGSEDSEHTEGEVVACDHKVCQPIIGMDTEWEPRTQHPTSTLQVATADNVYVQCALCMGLAPVEIMHSHHSGHIHMQLCVRSAFAAPRHCHLSGALDQSRCQAPWVSPCHQDRLRHRW